MLQANANFTLLYDSVRGISKNTLFNILDKSVIENMVNTIIICFHIRDCRGGKGERTIGRWCFEWIANFHSNIFIKIFKHIPHYGRWDDLLYINAKPLLPYIFRFYKIKLEQDCLDMMSGKPVSLLAKWLPTEGKSFNRRNKQTFKELLEILGMSRKLYRHKISTLRQYIDVVECHTCKKRWKDIIYSKVPSRAMYNLRNAFERHDPKRFIQWTRSKETPTSVIYPHTLIERYKHFDPVIEDQWGEICTRMTELGSFSNCIAVCDMSGSMLGFPMDISISLSLLISEMSTFGKYIIPFVDEPILYDVNGETLYERIQQIKQSPWGINVNITRIFALILQKGKTLELSDEQMPKFIFIISDMEFDQAIGYGHTNFKNIQSRYTHNNYTMPKIIFWNVSGDSNEYPISNHHDGHTIISGFSLELLTAIMSVQNLTPETIMTQILSSDRYDRIRNELLV
jgi:hypothetical protein